MQMTGKMQFFFLRLLSLVRSFKFYILFFFGSFFETIQKHFPKLTRHCCGKYPLSTPKRVRIRPKHSAPSLSRDRRIKMHQSINHHQNKIWLVRRLHDFAGLTICHDL